MRFRRGSVTVVLAIAILAKASLALAQPPSQPPGPPNLTGGVVSSPITLNWVPGSGGAPTLYEIHAGSAAGASDFGIFPVGLNTSITAAAPVGVRLYVRIVANNPHGSATSNEISFNIGEIAAPGSPTLTAAQVMTNPVTLNWMAGSGGFPTSYTLLASTASGQTDFGVFGMGLTTNITAAAPFNVPMFVRVVAHNAAGSATSNEVSFTVPSPPLPSVPVPVLQPPIVTGRAVQFTWTNGTPGASYTLRARRYLQTFPGELIASIPAGTGTSFAVSEVPYGSYFVSVMAQSAAGSAESDGRLIHVTAPPLPPAPTVQPPVVTSDQVLLSWIPAGPVSGYILLVRRSAAGALIIAPRLGPETSLTAANVPSGTYHISVLAIHTDGAQLSTESNQVVVTVQ